MEPLATAKLVADAVTEGPLGTTAASQLPHGHRPRGGPREGVGRPVPRCLQVAPQLPWLEGHKRAQGAVAQLAAAVTLLDAGVIFAIQGS